MFGILAQVAQLEAVGLPLDDGFDLDPEAWKAHLDAHPINLVFLSYPNNPTGTNFSAEVIRQILARPDTLVLLDEAYYEFSGHSLMEERERYPILSSLAPFPKHTDSRACESAMWLHIRRLLMNLTRFAFRIISTVFHKSPQRFCSNVPTD